VGVSYLKHSCAFLTDSMGQKISCIMQLVREVSSLRSGWYRRRNLTVNTIASALQPPIFAVKYLT